MDHNEWLKKHTKSVILDTTLVITADKFIGDSVPVTIHIVAIELDYGKVIDFTVKSDLPFTDPHEWSDHPFKHSSDKMESSTEVGSIIEDTPATRAMIHELVSKPELYTTTDCTHVSRLIKAISSFWS